MRVCAALELHNSSIGLKLMGEVPGHWSVPEGLIPSGLERYAMIVAMRRSSNTMIVE